MRTKYHNENYDFRSVIHSDRPFSVTDFPTDDALTRVLYACVTAKLH